MIWTEREEKKERNNPDPKKNKTTILTFHNTEPFISKG
jgi:hypothetical protein